MDTKKNDGTNENSSKRQKNNTLTFYQVKEHDKGVGLPYAPADFPEPGDHWTWKVGKRTTAAGYFKDRYLYPPRSYPEDIKGKKRGVNSRKAVKQYIQSRFPNTDPDEFLASFSWKIPAKHVAVCELEHTNMKEGNNGKNTGPSVDQPFCKVGNTSCISLAKQHEGDSPRFMICRAGCCNEPDYCRDCSCIFCRVSVSDKEGYSYIRCESLKDGAICGHVGHIKCAASHRMAGTFGWNIGLDAQYHCRHCHSRMDLVPHAEKLLNSIKSLTSRKSVEMALDLGFDILRDSTRSDAKILFDRFSSARAMLMNGRKLEDIWKEK